MFSSEEWIKVYEAKNAFWLHDGNTERPHALLSGGEHSSGFFNSERITNDTKILNFVASDLVELFVKKIGRTLLPKRMVGPAKGATRLAERMSAYVNAYRSSSQPICEWASPEKRGEGKNKEFFFAAHEPKVLPGERVLLCEDTVSTGHSVELVGELVERHRGVVLPFVLAIVNRTGQEEVAGRRVVSLISRHMPKWTPGECPLCPLGSEAIRPKGENWVRFTQDY